MYTEICQMIRAIQADDKDKALSYARLLAENLEKEGKPKEATRILRALGDQTLQSAPVSLDGIVPSRPRRWGDWDDQHNC